MKLHFVWRNAVKNIGDFWSSPIHYVDFGDIEQVRHDYRAFRFEDVAKEDVVIVGGGVCRAMLARPRPAGPIVIGWGVGTSVHGATRSPVSYGAHLNGIREWPLPVKDGIVHVPCASCLHPVFNPDNPRKGHQHEAVLFTNHDAGARAKHFPAGLEKKLPWMHNHQPILDVVEHLDSAPVVVTNSYHGAYWGQLLGKRVVAVNAYSSKFHSFQHPIAIARPGEDWRDALARHEENYTPQAGGAFLTEARWRNRLFMSQVQALIRRRRK